MHGTDNLQEDALIYHPVVRVSLVDASTGRYLSKRTPSQGAASSREGSTRVALDVSSKGMEMTRETSDCGTVPPMMTMPCKLGKGAVHVVAPSWSSQAPIVFDVDMRDVNKPSTLIFFEVLDFGPSIPARHLKKGGGFYRIAWAFLKPMSARGKSNVNIAPRQPE